MSNMSYCRFHNTRLDMSDCLATFEELDMAARAIDDAVKRRDEEELEELVEQYDHSWLSASESRSAYALFADVLAFAQDMGWCEGVDYEAIQTSVDSIS